MNNDKIDISIDALMPIPMCVVNPSGKIIGANDKIEEVFIYGNVEEADFFTLTGIKAKDIFAAVESGQEAKYLIERNSKKFRVVCEPIKDSQDVLAYFYDVTELETLKDKYDDEKICVCRINIDNYDQFNDAVSPETGMAITTEVNKIIRKMAQEVEGSIDRVKESQYVIHFQQKFLEALSAERFAILDQVRTLETGVDFPLSLSIGVGAGGKDLPETADFAAAALDLALGRGGDQAVVKNESRIQYYGGKTQSVEKSNKGKSRVVGHALKKLIEESDGVYIMGHKHADMDAFGSSLGVYRMCVACDVQAHIVINEIADSLKEFFNVVKDSGAYDIIGTEQAKKTASANSLVVVLDTHRPGYIEEPELLNQVEKIVVIDHHRRAEDAIENPTLAYLESYASSTAELVTEILQYMLNRKTLIRLEAEALLAGMTVDTNRFAVKTGVRTFEAAAWLRRSGADTAEVKRYFQMDKDTFLIKANAIATAVFGEDGVATAICQGEHQDAQVINAQVADELLDIKGVKASYVAGRNAQGVTCVSGRSLGDVNVQIIMEKFGGGGHLNVAGAQVKDSPEEIIEKILELSGKDGIS